MDPNDLSLPDLYTHLVAPTVDEAWARRLLDEDRPHDDITTESIVAPDATGEASIVMREDAVVAGLAALPAILAAADRSLELRAEAADGEACSSGARLAGIDGSLRSMLSSERVVLNLLGRLCGVATLTRAYVDAVAGTRAVICDTRKTTPGLRVLEKYAVRCGGGTLHRLNLSDAALYKDNHLAALPADCWVTRLAAAIRAVRARSPWFVQVEVDTMEQLRAMLRLDEGLVDVVLLDNMSLDELREAVSVRGAEAPAVRLEASGGVTLETVRAIAETGVDRISVGALTHAARSVDVGLDMVRG